MVGEVIYLRDLVGGTIMNIGTVRQDEDGQDMIYFYLDTELVFAADRANLWALTAAQFDDVFVDFTDFLERDSPLDEEDWRERNGTFLLLNDLIGYGIQQVSTIVIEGVRWVYLKLTEDCCLGIPFDAFIADGQFTTVWPDYADIEEPEGTIHGLYGAINQV